MASYYLPVQHSITDRALDALHDLMTQKLYTEVDEYDVTRATTVKVGYRQAAPTGVNVLIFENDEDNPEKWPHRPVKPKNQRPTGQLVGSQASDTARLFAPAGLHFIGGGSMYGAAFTIKLQIFGRSLPKINDELLTRDQTRQVASVLDRRIRRALHEAGPSIGKADGVSDDFGGIFVNGPFMGRHWTEQAEGESLNILKTIQFWYVVSENWNTNEW
jgi:hypothetical protein